MPPHHANELVRKQRDQTGCGGGKHGSALRLLTAKPDYGNHKRDDPNLELRQPRGQVDGNLTGMCGCIQPQEDDFIDVFHGGAMAMNRGGESA